MTSAKRLFSYIKYQIRKFIPEKLWDILAKSKKRINPEDFGEVDFRNSVDNQKMTNYVIRRQPPGAGLFSNMNHVLQGLLYAEKYNYQPSVDMANYWTSYSQSRSYMGTRNAWEYFFQPISEVSLDQIYRSGNVILSKGNRIMENHWIIDKGLRFTYEKEKIQELHEVYSRHIKLNDFSIRLLDRLKEYLDWSPESTLGAFYRGTDYLRIEPHGHPRQPSKTDFISKTIELSNRSGFSSVFIATDEASIRKELESGMKDRAVKNFRDYDFLKKFIPSNQLLGKYPEKNIVNTFGYLCEIYLLSECESFVGTLANGSVIAHVINGGKYSNPEIFDLGNY
jgi:hypothetical protein